MAAKYNNPFTPNFGQIPPHLAGREFLIGDVISALENWPGHPAQTTLFIGARGTGKTALISYLSGAAQELGWVSVNVACAAGMLDDILIQTQRAAGHLLETPSKRQLKSVTVGSIAAEWEQGTPAPSNWRSKMEDVLDALAKTETGLLITVDEVDANVDELVHLISVYQLLICDDRKIALLMAGLPTKVDQLVSHDRISFLRRSTQSYIGRIPDADVRAALAQTVAEAGKCINGNALDLAVDAIGGFAYMIQLVGYRTWQASLDAKTITAEHARRGIEYAREDFITRVLNTTFDELSDTDLAFLKAMLDVSARGDAVTSEAVAKALGRSNNYAATYRNRLMQCGIIEREGRNNLKFSLPMVGEYLPKYLNLE